MASITVPTGAPIYVRIAASIAAHADDFRRGNRAPMDAAARHYLAAAQVEVVSRAAMCSTDPAGAVFDLVVGMLGPAPEMAGAEVGVGGR